MNTGFVQVSRRWIVTFLLAAMIAVTAAYGPVLLYEVAGVSVSMPAYACNSPGGGC
jgi:hypothetical protein